MASARSSHKIFLGPVQDHARTFQGMSAKPSQDLLIRTITRSCKDLGQDFIRILQGCTMKLLQDRHRRDQDQDNCFVRACAVKMYMDMSQEQFYARIVRGKAGAQDRENPAAQTLCEPAQSKCTWTRLCENLLGKRPESIP